jgi:hypothetical protein
MPLVIPHQCLCVHPFRLLAAPFFQLPMATIGGITLAQSNAIARLIARRGGILGDSDADFARSEEVGEIASPSLFGVLPS